jgi:nucleoside 2-deoxyribosyltransferase
VKVIYVGGPYKARTPEEVERNIAAASDMAFRVWSCGHVAICPHLNVPKGAEEKLPRAVFLMGDLAILRRCDALLVVGDWESSAGTVAEWQEAKRLGLPAFETLEALLQYPGW